MKMDDAQILPTQALTGTAKAQIDLAWEMGLASLAANGNQLVLTKSVFDAIGIQVIDILKERLSITLGGTPIVSLVDQDHKMLRLTSHPDYTVASTCSSQPTSSEPIDQGSSPYLSNKTPSSKLRAYGKKSKIPRPPNAFILYRQHHHPILKSHFPDMHNNQISVKLGQQWKHEPTEVKDKYRKLSDSMKKRHAAQYPNYQYAPRKPGEKKRRMTARKMEREREAQHDQESSAFFPQAFTSDHHSVSNFDPIISCNYGQGGIGDYVNFGDFDNYNLEHEPSVNTNLTDLTPSSSQAIISLPNDNTNIQAALDEQLGSYESESVIDSTGPSWQQANFDMPSELMTDQNLLDALIDWQGLAYAMGNVTGSVNMHQLQDPEAVPPTQQQIDMMIAADRVHLKDVEAVQATGPNIAFQCPEESIDALKELQPNFFP